MTSEIRVPTLGESITEATIAQWYKQPGEAVNVDEPLCELETDKVTIEVPAAESGMLSEIMAQAGDTVEVGALLGMIEAGAAGAKTKTDAPKPAAKPAAKAAAKEAAPKAAAKAGAKAEAPKVEAVKTDVPANLAPSVRRIAAENDLDTSQIAGTGKDGRITKGDALKAVAGNVPVIVASSANVNNGPREERVRMTRLRKTIARRLKESQNTAAMLTTFNEIDMSALMALRSSYKEAFEKKHGARLGFMSFFVRACVSALHEIPAVNAEISDDEIIYKNYVNMGVAVGTEKGLVVPVLRDVQMMGFADIENTIAGLGRKARDGDLAIDDLQGGTFTISNGGVYGSLMSTPILNAPQSGILGMHKIQDRPVVVDGQIVVRPMMYLALSYDHRIVDGKEAVTFLVRVKESLENPERLLLDI
jgi:2-oxoglutarate dehydrogenase E2 component (dihydrolipoamide succinyltransferase)